MKYIFMTAAIALALVNSVYLGGCNYRRVPEIKQNAPQVWSDAGFEIVAYEGYQIGNFLGNPGGKVWYVIQRKGDASIRYEGCLSYWQGEFHIYALSAIDAISPSSK